MKGAETALFFQYLREDLKILQKKEVFGLKMKIAFLGISETMRGKRGKLEWQNRMKIWKL